MHVHIKWHLNGLLRQMWKESKWMSEPTIEIETIEMEKYLDKYTNGFNAYFSHSAVKSSKKDKEMWAKMRDGMSAHACVCIKKKPITRIFLKASNRNFAASMQMHKFPFLIAGGRPPSITHINKKTAKKNPNQNDRIKNRIVSMICMNKRKKQLGMRQNDRLSLEK